jgi:hypothetical protein
MGSPASASSRSLWQAGTDDAQPHPPACMVERTRWRTNVRCGALYDIGTPNTDSASSGTSRPWHIFGTSCFVRCVRCVRETPQNERSGRRRTYFAPTNKVEGLVDRLVRGGSSPLGRMEKACKSVAFGHRTRSERFPLFASGGPWQRRGNIQRTHDLGRSDRPARAATERGIATWER